MGREKSADPDETQSLWLSPRGIWLSCLPAPPTLADTANQHREDLDMVGHVLLFAVLGARDAECACLNDSACLRLNCSNIQVL